MSQTTKAKEGKKGNSKKKEQDFNQFFLLLLFRNDINFLISRPGQQQKM